MFPPFELEPAKTEALKLIQELDDGLFLEFLENAPGQMFGIAICSDGTVLRAFSGQLAGNGRWIVPGFVPPCIDVEKWKLEVERADPAIKELTAKIEAAEIFACGSAPILDDAIGIEEIALLKEKRRALSNESLKNIYSMYSFTCWDGHTENYESLASSIDAKDVFALPTGTGDCCAPKLINHAYKNGLAIVSMAEFFYGNEPTSGARKHKEFYPPCDEKCGLLLPKMLGLEILYRDSDIIVVNKPTGLLSAPGKGPEKFDCVPYRVKKLIPGCIEQPCVHRLDMDTSGILVLGLTKESHRALSMQFENRTVHKKYRALLRGRLTERLDKLDCTTNELFKVSEESASEYCGSIDGGKLYSGIIRFAMRVDLENRPYQIYDPINGRMAETQWHLVKEYKAHSGSKSSKNPSEGEWHTLVEFTPLTGRTHQLRFHSASSRGLGIPIVGDRLYGQNFPGERLCLQAFYLEFDHPVTGKRMCFETKPEF